MKPQPHILTLHSVPWLAAGMFALGVLRAAMGEEPTPSSNEPVIHVLDWTGTQERIRAEHQGHVVVVNLWTNTCPACVEDFPEFAGLLESFDRDEFAFVSLNCDYDGAPGKPPAYYQPRVSEFLKRQRNGIDHVMLSEPLIDFMEAVKLDSTPALFLFDRDGKLVRRFDNDDADSADEEFTLEQVETAVRELLDSRE